MYKNAVTLMIILAGLALASCSGGLGAPAGELDNLNAAAPVAPQATDSEIKNSEQGSSPVGNSAELAGPVLPHSSSFWGFEPGDDIHWWDLFENMHQNVSHGENVLDQHEHMMHGGPVFEYQQVIGWDNSTPPNSEPIMGNCIGLESTVSEPAFATFGLRGFPAGEELTKIHLGGSSEGMLWIGVGGFGSKAAYRWFGPYNLNEANVDLTLPYLDSVNDSGYGYITLLTQGGEAAWLNNFTVTVGEQVILPVPDFEFEDFNPIGF